MTVTSCPILDLYPVLEGQGATSQRIVEENFRRIMEWVMLACAYMETIDGGSP